MAKILVGWEFGAGLGHLTRLLPVLKNLRAAGHDITLVAQNLVTAKGLLDKEGLSDGTIKLLQAPAWPMPVGPNVRKIPTQSFADVLKIFSFHDLSLLGAMVTGWRGIIAATRPALIVAEFAPALVLAAGKDLPLVVTANGYTAPPGGRPLPPIRPWEKTLPERSSLAEQEILGSVHTIQKGLGQTPVEHLSDLFCGSKTFICTIPEFDPYGAYRKTPTLMPFNLPAIPKAPPLASRPGEKVFAYLPVNHAQVKLVLEGLKALNLETDIYVPRLPAKAKATYAAPHLTFHDQPLALDEVLPAARVIVHHGGLSTTYTALLAGTPQLLLTNNLEHLVTGYGLSRFNSSIVLRGDQLKAAEDLAKHVTTLTTKEKYVQGAGAAARQLAGRPVGDSVSTILSGCLELLPS